MFSANDAPLPGGATGTPVIVVVAVLVSKPGMATVAV
jgi:hypothetical protein